MRDIISNIVQKILGLFGRAPVYIPPPLPPKVTAVTDFKKTHKLQFNFNDLKSKEWEGIVLHHSASVDGVTRDADGIAKFHMSYRIDYKTVTKEEFERRKAIGDGLKFEEPYRAVGYHFLIEYVNKDIVLNYGRPLWMPGAHAGHPTSNKYNLDYIGICVIGNFDEDMPSKEVINYTIAVCRALVKRFDMKKDNIIGHRETYTRLGVPVQKQCPGKNWDMDKFRADL